MNPFGSRRDVQKQFNFPEMMRALRPVGAADKLVNSHIGRNNAYGIPPTDRGTGNRRMYNYHAILSMALQVQICREFDMTPATTSQVIVPDIWDRIEAEVLAGRNVEHIWAVQGQDNMGKVFKIVLSDRALPDFLDDLVKKLDLRIGLERVATELRVIAASRVSEAVPVREPVPAGARR